MSPTRTVRPRVALTVQYAAAGCDLPSRSQLRKWIRAALEHDASITVRLVGRPESRALNRRFRGKDRTTNVLTFVFRDMAPFEGDVALCVPVIAAEARTQGIKAVAHFAHLVVHGILHLQGYAHDNNADARVMEERESQIVVKLGYQDPYVSEKPKVSSRGRRGRASMTAGEPFHG